MWSTAPAAQAEAGVCHVHHCPFFLVLEPSVMGPITMEGEARSAV